MTYQTIEIERHDAVARIFMNRPGARNAQNTQMLDELDAAFASLGEDATVRVVVLAGRGEHFCAGHDLKETREEKGMLNTEGHWQYEERRYVGYCLKILDFPKPTICQVQGGCIAAGFAVANMCDLIVASEDAYFSDPTLASLSAASLEVLIHPWVLGMRKAKELLFTGERLGAAEALQIGMINRMVPKQELDEATMALAHKIAKNAPFATRLTKRSLNRTMEIQGLKAALSAHFDLHQLSHTTDEFAEFRRRGVANVISQVAKS
ncbi:enoyl-CoA hydratase [Ramlibacter henchirensis]|uniref:Enoyl-CoA hydratase n=1 Tax=Ramlibacter henchirensis TaxID=204072 RepID=A0A4Z0BX02_9BURK|nr:enoyl-CoA hydratase [Ramlibacter henchirensis]TFZ02890.1 enoyl-CoA hydratase [Ramlibacter henchirensis]